MGVLYLVPFLLSTHDDDRARLFDFAIFLQVRLPLVWDVPLFERSRESISSYRIACSGCLSHGCCSLECGEGVEDGEGEEEEEEEGKGRWKDGWMDGVGIKWERKGGMRERNEKKRRKKARK